MYNVIFRERLEPIDEEEASESLEDSFIDSGISHGKESARVRPGVKLSSLFSFFVNSRHYYCLLTACLATVISGFVVPIMSVVIGRIFDSLLKFSFENEKKLLGAEIRGFLWQLVGLGIGAFICNGALSIMWQRCADLQAKRARECIFEGLIVRDLKWFDERRHGVGAMVTQIQT